MRMLIIYIYILIINYLNIISLVHYINLLIHIPSIRYNITNIFINLKKRY